MSHSMSHGMSYGMSHGMSHELGANECGSALTNGHLSN